MSKSITMALIFVVLAFWISSATAITTWERAFGSTGDEVAFFVSPTRDSGYVATGHTYYLGSTYKDIYVVKTNTNGILQWQRAYGGPDSDVGYCIIQTRDGGYLIVGLTHSFGVGASDIYVVKTNATGETLWTTTWGGAGEDWGRSAVQTEDDGYLIVGSTFSYGAGFSDVCVVKIDSAGQVLWWRTFGGTNYDEGNEIITTADGGYAIVGISYSFGAGDRDIYLVKLDSECNLEWQRTYGGNADEFGFSVAQTQDNGFVIAGTLSPFMAGYSDVYLAKVSESGELNWQNLYGGEFSDFGYYVVPVVDGGFLVAGYTYSYGSGQEDFYLIKTDANGNLSWQRTYGGTNSELAYCIKHTLDNGFIIAGATNSFGAGGSDVFLVKTDSLGITKVENTESTSPTLNLSVTPNPFNSFCIISTSIGAEINIFDIGGKCIKSIKMNNQQYLWSASDDLKSGVYLVRAKFGEIETMKRIIYMK